MLNNQRVYFSVRWRCANLDIPRRISIFNASVHFLPTFLLPLYELKTSSTPPRIAVRRCSIQGTGQSWESTLHPPVI